MNKKQIWMFVGLIALVFVLFFIINMFAGNDTTSANSSLNSKTISKTIIPSTTRPSNSSTNVSSTSGTNNTTLQETMIAPVDRTKSYEIVRKFYDASLPENQQVEAIMVYIGSGYTSYISSTGASYSLKDGSDFDVISIFSGVVVDVRDNPLLNSIITIESSNGVEITYYSLKKAKVEVGDQVNQGQVIASSSVSILDSQLNSHVYIEVKKDGNYLNPESYIGKKLSELGK